MNKTAYFLKLFIGIYCPLSGIAGWLLYLYGSVKQLTAAFWGSIVSVVLAWITVLAINKLYESSPQGLFVLMFGGMLFRLFAVFIAGILVYYLTDLLIISFFIGLLCSYLLLQVIEIIYISKRFVK